MVALTAHAFGEETARCMAVGMDGFLTKPIQIEELYRFLDTVVRHVAEERLEPEGALNP